MFFQKVFLMNYFLTMVDMLTNRFGVFQAKKIYEQFIQNLYILVVDVTVWCALLSSVEPYFSANAATEGITVKFGLN